MTTPSPNEPVLVTGASGLLGSAIAAFLRSQGHTVIALRHATPLPQTQPLDLEETAARRSLETVPWRAIVHCAAYRSPDFCEEHRDTAHRLNTEVPAELAALAAARDARFIHISTDYVFDGTSAPYHETDAVCPVNYYGETKAEAESRIATVHPTAVILRVPALYGAPPPPITSALMEEGIQAALSNEETEQDDVIVRFPTHTNDIATVIGFLLSADNVSGIVHASAPTAVTRYGWARALCGMLGRDPAHIHPSRTDPSRKARRPVNSQLNTDRLAALGAPMPAGYEAHVPQMLRHRGLAP